MALSGAQKLLRDVEAGFIIRWISYGSGYYGPSLVEIGIFSGDNFILHKTYHVNSFYKLRVQHKIYCFRASNFENYYKILKD